MMEIIKDRKESINSLVLWVQHNGNTVERPAHIAHVFNVRKRIFKKKGESEFGTDKKNTFENLTTNRGLALFKDIRALYRENY